ncbi:hypothetical protein BC939DRAFT_441948 [Gamsiella multidivaricata]|uniref:uncharacterized protein n=1 Tax=Gamsiella multidivaricata TaxID=101098 RepID=UPI00221E7F44|nr:uncharacterized protein BC939DRAFT_441948 [Gamsiella multidivaricata]KAI7829449.1 hypothetical protein BC939DRAFT_441948 [Gamsiella multidivaricata]
MTISPWPYRLGHIVLAVLSCPYGFVQTCFLRHVKHLSVGCVPYHCDAVGASILNSGDLQVCVKSVRVTRDKENDLLLAVRHRKREAKNKKRKGEKQQIKASSNKEGMV